MSDFDWKKTLAKVAPVIAGSIGGPFGAVAVNVATTLLGIDNNENALAEAISSGDPQIMLKLKEADQQFELEKRKLDNANTEGARQLGIAKGIIVQAVLSFLFIAGYFVIFGVVIYAAWNGVDFSPAMLTLVSTLMGIMTAAVTQIMNFWFGSSSGSRAKDAAKAIKEAFA